MPCPRRIEPKPRRAVDNAVEIMPFFRIEPRRKIIRHGLGADHCNRRIHHQRVESAHDRIRLACLMKIDMRYLPARMHPRIRAPGALHLDGGARVHECGAGGLDHGLQAGYSNLLLDTLDDMEAARGLYASLGFEEIPPYYFNPIPGAHYLRVELG